ncbi:SPOC domain-containing protein 1 [Cricetulus griseus]|uniref:SPOC domain-containing protein 1 n=1 Tax=Cricetulus griseus TaxID=10029 RepID=G3H1V9_CRIGR|nr:SPOC domain-containing protein 1 [Cricetulus griseus]ERE85406.1 SPOC domain-containing protein 1 [Cricetulus griseus]
MEAASSPGPGEGTMVEGMGFPEGDGTVPTLTKEKLSGKVLPVFPARHPRRVRRKSKKCGICPQDEEEAGFFLRLRQSLDGDCWPTEGPPQSAPPVSSAGPQWLISSKDTGPGDPGGSWIDSAEFECMLFSKNVAQPGSLDHLFGFPGLFGDESLSLATQDSLQSPPLNPGVLTGGSTEQQEAHPVFMVGSSGTPPDPEGPEVEAQPVSKMGLGQGLAAPAEPLGDLRGASLGQRRPKEVKKRRWTGPVSCAQKQRTDTYSQDHPEEAFQRGCPGGVCSGPVIQLLGAFSNRQPGGQLETLEDLMKVSSTRRQRKPTTSPPASCQSDFMETESEEPLQQGTEDPGEQDTMPLDAGVRSTVVRTMQEVLWTRVQELPDLPLRKEEVASIAEDIEAALFHLTQDTNLRYKTKYRSLLFNLKDPRNSDLILKVAQCDVSPQDLVQMSSIQLAPKELSRWRDQEERRGLDIIEQQQKELYRLPTSKLTHKGEVEIPRDSDQMLTLEDLMEPMMPREFSPQALTFPLEDTTEQHQHHFWDSNCHTCKDGKEGRTDVSNWKSSTKLPAFSEAIVNKEENVIQKAPGPAPVSSPEMLKTGETPSKEPRDRLQMPAGPKNVPPSPPPWEGSLDMFSIKQFRAKAQLISGHSCQLVQDICVVRLCPRGSRDIQNYRLLYSYLNNKQRHCLATVQHVKTVLMPLPAFQPLPARLRPLGGPGLETTHTSLLLAVLFPKDGLPDTALSSPLWNKVPKTVSFSKKVERRCYHPEDRTSEATLGGSPSHEEAPKQSLVKGSLAPSVCAWQSLPRGRGRQEHGWGQQSPEASWCYPKRPNSGGPVFPGIGHGQHRHRASCFHQGLLQHLKVLVTMSHQFQASLWPPGQEPLLPSSPVSAVPRPPGPIPKPSLGPMDGGGSECPWPERPDPLDPPEQECSSPYQS